MDFNEYIKKAKDMGVDENELNDLMSDFIDCIEDLKAEQEEKNKKAAEAEAKNASDLDEVRHEAATALVNYFALAFPDITDGVSVEEIEGWMKEEEKLTRKAIDGVNEFVSMFNNKKKKKKEDNDVDIDDIIDKFLKGI